MDRSVKKLFVNLGIAFAILFAFITFVGWGEIFSAIKGAYPVFVVLGITAGITSTFVRGFTWKIIFESFGYDYSLGELFQIYYTGVFANGVTPLGQLGGEPFLAYVLSKKYDINYEKKFGALFSADMIISLPFFTMSVAGLVYFLTLYPSRPIISLLSAFILLPTIGVVLFFIATWHLKGFVKRAAIRIRNMILSVVNFITFNWDQLKIDSDGGDMHEKVDRFYESVEFAFTNKGTVSRAIYVSHLARFMDFVSVFAFLLSLGIKPEFLTVLFIVPMAGMGFYLPLPGGIGGQQLIMSLLLVFIANIPLSTASAAVLMYRISTFGFIMLVGGLCAIKMSNEML